MFTQRIKHCLATLAVLLGSMAVNAATFEDWTSTNKSHSSTSSHTYTFTATGGSILSFDWSVSSEANCDKLIVTLDGSTILEKSGSLNSTYTATLGSGEHTLVVKYTKDGSVSNGSDQAKIFNINVAEPITLNGVNYFLNVDNTATVCGLPTDTSAALVIDSLIAIDGVTYNVTSISTSAFENCTNLTSITIPNSIMSIENAAFKGCSALNEVIIEDGNTVLTLGYNASNQGLFYDCPLESVYLGRNLNYESSSSCGMSPFYDKRTLTSVTIGRKVTSIGSFAFHHCGGLTSLTMGEAVTSIGDSAFSGCSELTSITIPGSVTNIDNYVFNGCSSLKDIIFEDSEKTLTLGYNSRYNTSYQMGTGKGLFYDCPLETVYVGRSLSYDSYQPCGYSPFYNKTDLTSVTIGNKVTFIDDDAFSGCSKLVSIAIPGSVTSIGCRVFDNCSSLKEVIFEDGEETLALGYNKYGRGGEALFYDSPLETVYLGRNLSYDSSSSCGSSPFYNKTTLTSVMIGDKVTSIADNAFERCREVTSIIIPNSVISIGNYAFFDCNSLASLIIGDGVTSIGIEAFYCCNKLVSITIPGSVTSISRGVFRRCSSIKDIIFEDGEETLILGYNDSNQALFYDCPLESVYLGRNLNYESSSSCGYSPFYNKTDLTSVTIGNKVTFIADYAFSGCSKLVSIAIPGSVTSIGDFVFDNCNSIKDIIFEDGEETLILGYNDSNQALFYDCPLQTVYMGRSLSYNNIQSYGCSPFYNKTALKSVMIGEKVTSIADNAFYGCSGITSIRIPNSVISIGNYAFYNCNSLASLTIGKGVTSIGNSAFYNCNELTSVVIPDSVISMGDYVFYGCNSLAFLIIGESVTSIGNSTFYNCNQITSIIIPNNVTSIDTYAFNGCTALAKLTIGNSVSSIGAYAFANCNDIESIYALNPKAITCDESIFSTDTYNNAKLYVPEGRVFAYEKASPWSKFYIESIKTFSITYMLEGDVYKIMDVKVGAEIVLPDSPTKEGYTFVGWVDIPTIMPAEDVKVYASFTPNNYTVTFKANGTIVSSESLTYGGTIVAPIAPEVEGYTFVEWEGLLETVPAHDVEFVAVYRENVYMVEDITLSQNTATITKGETLILTAAVTPANATDSSISWSSSNTNVATVDNNGKVTAIASGNATITATANDGSGVSVSCEVTVEQSYVDYVTITINQYGSGTYSSEYALDFSEVQGLKAYVATGYNYLTGEVTLLRVRTAEAGTGLLIKGTPGVSYEVPVIESTADRTLNMLVATLEKTKVNGHSDDGVYANYKYTVVKEQSPEPLFYQFTDGSNLSAGKAYLQIPMAWLPATGQRALRYRFDEGETTDIDVTTDDGGQSTVIYDLMGRRVASPKKGEVYIINNKKVVY